jgi:hypothetical protein
VATAAAGVVVIVVVGKEGNGKDINGKKEG